MSDANTQNTKATEFAALHVPGTPIILFNAWDAGSVLATVEAGAKAVGTGGHGVANSLGYEDGEQMPVEALMANTARITAVTDLPVTIDIDGGYGETPEEVGATVTKAIEAGVVGINFEDQFVGGDGIHDINTQVARIAGARAAADAAGVSIYINARTDVFFKADPSEHASKLDEAIERATAYAAAGASGIFVPALTDLDLIKKLCEASPLPVNVLKVPGSADTSDLAAAGVARISYGPFPYLDMIEWVKENAAKAYSA